MRKNSRKKIRFTSSKRRQMEGRFDGGEVSSDGGLILMREVDRRLGLIKSVARRLGDTRQKGKVRHDVATLVRQRVMALCTGWEDLNDSEELGHDPMHQLASGSDTLGSAPTLSRFENAQNRASAWAVNEELVEQFIRSKKKAPAPRSRSFPGPMPAHPPTRGTAWYTLRTAEPPFDSALTHAQCVVLTSPARPAFGSC